jgi:hypothetical protein
LRPYRFYVPQVKGMPDVLTGLAAMVEAETLSGDNQYFCETCDVRSPVFFAFGI